MRKKIGGFKYNQLKISQTMQKLQISISCIITGLILKGFICQKFTRFFLAEKIYSSQTYMHFFNIKRKTMHVHVLFTCEYKKSSLF